MADDGLLLNFSLGDDPLKAKPVFKGGRWKDRLTAKKAARRFQQNQNTAHTPSQGSVVADGEAERGSERHPKRQRVEGEDDRINTSTRSRHGRTAQPRSDGSSKPHQVISSLFSFNPTPKNAQEESAEEEQPVQPSNAPLDPRLETFTNLGLSSTLAAHLLDKLELKTPTGIQKAAVSQLLKDDSDAFIQAQTGSGKTLAYLLPIVQRLMTLGDGVRNHEAISAEGKIHRDSGLFAIILAPTRELCKQISVVLESLLRCAHWIVAGSVIGGEKKKSEKARLRKGLNILVATPGRLADHLDNTEVLDVSKVRWLVLDEGDRLMELGFEAEIQKLITKLESSKAHSRAGDASLQRLPPRRVTILCSATLKMNVQRLGEISLKEAIHISPDPTDEVPVHGEQDKFSAPDQLRQAFAVVPAKLRLVSLIAVLKRTFIRRGSVMKAIVFISCADSVDFLFEILSRQLSEENSEGKITEDGAEKNGLTQDTVALAPSISGPENPVHAYKLHGSLPQNVRSATLASYSKSKDPGVLICTDVASRGLDVPNVDYVIEYDPPFSKDEHIHRVGRTARAGKDGRALIFLLPGDEEGYIKILKDSYRSGRKAVVGENGDELLRKGFTSVGVTTGRDWEEKATEWQLEVERWVLQSPKHLEMARRAYQSHIRAYATHVAPERHIFNIKALHLGHLAKAFALRDKPGSINVPGLRSDKGAGKSARGGKGQGESDSPAKRRRGGDDDLDMSAANNDDAARRMRLKMQEHMSAASEFNIG